MSKVKGFGLLFFSCWVFAGILGSCGGGKSVSSICRDVCEMEKRCDPDEFDMMYDSVRECQDGCIQMYDLIKANTSSACASAYKDLGSCLSRLSCSEYEDYMYETTANYPCADKDRAMDDVCGFN